MPTDFLLNQPSAREADLARLRSRAWRTAQVNTRPSFDRVTIVLHWATVVLVLVLFASAGLHALAEARQSDFAPVVLQIHRSLGVTIWVVTALRLAWRLTNASMPPFPEHMGKLHRVMTKFSEYGLYALLLVQPATGLLTTLFNGRPFALLLLRFPPLMPRDDVLRAAFNLSHELGAWTLAALAVSHAGAALFHHFVLRDDVLACMAPVMHQHVPDRAHHSTSKHIPGIKATH